MDMPVELDRRTNRQGHVVLLGAPSGHTLRVTLAERADANEFAAEVARRWNAHAALLAACEELRDACAAAFRVCARREAAEELGCELRLAGIEDGMGTRADTAIAKARGES